MQRFPSPAPALLAILLLSGLAGCAADSDTLACPEPAVLEQGATLTEYLPGRSDVAAQVTTARITGVAGSCVLHKKKHVLDVTFRAGFSATNGPANEGDRLNLPYAVWITQDDNVISENDYTIALDFNGNESTAQATSKPIKVELPGDFSGDLQILIGFKLTPAQLSAEQ